MPIFERAYNSNYAIIGNYLFTHAGVDPEKSLAEQGVGLAPDGKPLNPTYLTGKDYFDSVMIRDRFLWRDSLPKCDYVIVHGHTPSIIPDKLISPDKLPAPDSHFTADGQKNYRLCIDTGVCDKEKKGALTCFMRYGNDVTNDKYQAGFMAVNQAAPGKVEEYSIPKAGQHAAQLLQLRAQYLSACAR